MLSVHRSKEMTDQKGNCKLFNWTEGPDYSALSTSETQQSGQRCRYYRAVTIGDSLFVWYCPVSEALCTSCKRSSGILLNSRFQAAIMLQVCTLILA
jgi:hypothetical protein